MIELRNVSFQYPKQQHPVLRDINLQIEPGDFVVILGRNGSGKSTLARLVDGLLMPAGGQVLVDGLDTADSAQRIKLRQKIGMLFSNPDNQLFSSVVEEDVAFGPENLGLPPPEIRRRVEWALEVVGMVPYRRHPTHLLSGGQKQKVAIAGILALEPDYMVLDEPTSMLDPQGRDEVLETLSALNRRGTGMVFITHFVEEALLGKRVLVLDRGGIVLEGSPQDILSSSEELEAAGIEPLPAAALARLLRGRGWEVPCTTNMEDLVDCICRLNAER